MNKYYMLVQDGKILSYAETTGSYPKTEKPVRICALSEAEYRMLSACKGDIKIGILVLKNLRDWAGMGE